MALPVEIANFFALLRDIWGAFPLMARQVLYLSIGIMGVLAVMKSVK